VPGFPAGACGQVLGSPPAASPGLPGQTGDPGRWADRLSPAAGQPAGYSRITRPAGCSYDRPV